MDRSRLIATWTALAIAATIGAGCREEPDPTTAPPPPPPALATSPGPHSAIPSVAPELGLTVENYPRVDGSTSAEPLLRMTACRILAAGCERQCRVRDR
jgi:hypothetical protein